MQLLVLAAFCIVLYFVVYVFGRKKEEKMYIPVEDWREFEFAVAKMFENKGYRAFVTQGANDGGKDIIIYDDEDRAFFVECKYYSESKIGRPLVQKLAGAMQGANADGGFFVSTTNFTKEALEYAKLVNITCLTVDSNLIS